MAPVPSPRAVPRRRLAALLAAVAACGGCTAGAALDADRACALAAEAASRGDASALVAELARALRIDPATLRVDPAGVFVPQRSGFVAERGLFVAFPGAALPGVGTDPSFARVDACVYRYAIDG